MKDLQLLNLTQDQLTKEATKQVCESLIKKIFSSIYNSQESQLVSSNIDSTENSTFSQKKGKREVFPSQKYSKPKHPNPSRGSKSSKKKPTRGKRPSDYWDRAQINPPRLTNDCDFPPLSAGHSLQVETESLHLEILKYGDNTARKVQDKFQFIYLMLQRIEYVVAEQVGGCIRLFGSYATGLAIESSDIDLGVIGVDIHNRQLLHTACLTLSNSLKLLPFVQSSNAILTARIPVIKVQVDLQCFSGIPSPGLVDVSFVETFECAHQGFQAISFTKDLLILFPSVRYLTMVLKNFLYSVGLNSSYHGKGNVGGLSSYSLILWITASLNSMKTVPNDYAEQLEYFLDFFGNKFNPKVFGVNVVNRGSLFVLDNASANEHAVTIDPTNRNNNTTRSSFKIKEVIEEFAQAHARIKEIRAKGKRRPTLKQIFKKFNR
jgi:DNA polymerase sigma